MIVNNTSFEDFDLHRELYRKQNPSSEAIVECHLLLYWIAETHPHVHTVVEYGQTYYILKDEELKELAWWVQQLHDKAE